MQIQPPKQTQQSQAITPQKLLPFMFAIRFILSMFIVRNYDHPDEYWQGPEIAHYLVFGYGHRTWEWTLEKPIRNHTWPLLLSVPYRIIQYLNLDDTVLIFFAPKFLQAFIGTTFDYMLLKLNHIYNPGTTLKILIINYTNWFSLSIISRTYIQALETTLTLIAFYIWNIKKASLKLDYLCRFLAIIFFVIRSTSIMFWAIVWPYQLFTMAGSLKDRFYFIIRNIITVCLMVVAAVLFEYFWRGEFTFIEYNFVNYNILQKWAQFYGVQSYLSCYYLYLPLILGGSLPFFYFGVTRILSKKSVKSKISRGKQLIIQVLLVMALVSTSNHKQPRYFAICLPILLIICVRGYFQTRRSNLLFVLSILVNLFIFNVHAVHGRDGPIKVLQDLRQQNNVQSVMFLTHCHYTPMYSNFHHKVPIRFPDCSALNRAKGVDQNTIFRWNATEIYLKMLKDFQNAPSHLVVEGQVLKNFNIPRKQYHMVSQYRNCGFLEQIFNGYNSVSLWKRNDIEHSVK